MFFVLNGDLGGSSFLRSLLRIGICDHTLFLTVVDTLEFLTGTDGPVDGAGGNAKLLLDIIQQFKGISCLTVHLVDEGENRDLAHHADLEQLSRLGLDTLGSIDDHNCGVRCHQGTVGILREILMSRGIQNIDAVTVIFKLQYGRGNGNTSVFLNLHPVGYRMSGRCLTLYASCQVDGSSVEQELLGQGRLAGIRVGNNGKRPAAVDLFCIIITHYYSPPNISLISLKIYFRSSSGSAIYDGSAFKTELPSNSGWIPK